MGQNTSLDAGLNRIVAEIEAEYPKMLEARNAKLAELEAINKALHKAERVLRILRPEEYAVTRKTKKKSVARVSDERRGLIVNAVNELLSERGEVRQADVVKRTGLRSGPVSIVFGELRDEEVLRLFRVDKPTGSQYFKFTRRVSTNGAKV